MKANWPDGGMSLAVRADLALRRAQGERLFLPFLKGEREEFGLQCLYNYVENNLKYLLSPPWERIEVRGQRL